MVESKGTSKEKAHWNQSLRQEIASHDDITSFFNTYTLEEGFIVIDRMTAIWHGSQWVKERQRKNDIFFVSFNGKSNNFIITHKFKKLIFVTKMII